MKPRKAYSFDDVMLGPALQRDELPRRCRSVHFLAGVALRIPIIAANMSSVCEDSMGIAMGEMGGLGIIHRMCSVEGS